MANNRNVWVVGAKSGWMVKREGASRASSSYRTQAEAWHVARELARETNGEAILQGLDGRIHARDTFRGGLSRRQG